MSPLEEVIDYLDKLYDIWNKKAFIERVSGQEAYEQCASDLKKLISKAKRNEEDIYLK